MSEADAVWTDDVCSLDRVRRLAAMLDREPADLREGQALPKGWHPALFNHPTRQSMLRGDGSAELGVRLPDVGLPRLMLGGRRQQFLDDIPIGARVRRQSKPGEVVMKSGRSGPFALVGVEHRIHVEDASEPAVIEHQQYVLRPAAEGSTVGGAVQPEARSSGGARAVGAAASSAVRGVTEPASIEGAQPELSRLLLPDERLLFRYSAITDNPHRIHYDRDYARHVERYPDLVVNGTIPAMFLLEMFRTFTAREPQSIEARNVAPMFCNQPLTLSLRCQGEACLLSAQDSAGRLTYEAQVR